eukprot:4390939-Amphidinium_carterae.1
MRCELYPGDIYVCGGSRDGVQGGLNTVQHVLQHTHEGLNNMCMDSFVLCCKIASMVWSWHSMCISCPQKRALLCQVECFDPLVGAWRYAISPTGFWAFGAVA